MLADQAVSAPPPRLLTRGLEVGSVEGYGFDVHDLRVAGTTPRRPANGDLSGLHRR